MFNHDCYLLNFVLFTPSLLYSFTPPFHGSAHIFGYKVTTFFSIMQIFTLFFSENVQFFSVTALYKPFQRQIISVRARSGIVRAPLSRPRIAP